MEQIEETVVPKQFAYNKLCIRITYVCPKDHVTVSVCIGKELKSAHTQSNIPTYYLLASTVRQELEVSYYWNFLRKLNLSFICIRACIVYRCIHSQMHTCNVYFATCMPTAHFASVILKLAGEKLDKTRNKSGPV